MKRFINNYYLLMFVELIILYMFNKSINTNDIMNNTFSIIIIVIFIIPVVLLYFSNDIVPIFNNMIIPRLQSNNKLYKLIIERIFLDAFIVTCIFLVPLHILTIFLKMNFFMIMRYYYNFFLVFVMLFMIYMIIYLKFNNKNIAIIVSYITSNITNLLSGLFRSNIIPDLSSLIFYGYNKVILLFIILLMIFILNMIKKIEFLGDYKNGL